MIDFKFHGHQSMKLQLSYEIMFGYVQKLPIAHVIPLKTIKFVSYNKFSKPRPGRAGYSHSLGAERENFICHRASSIAFIDAKVTVSRKGDYSIFI